MYGLDDRDLIPSTDRNVVLTVSGDHTVVVKGCLSSEGEMPDK
jgi:hypothetical protein